MNSLPAGLFDSNQEFFASAEMKAFSLSNGAKIPFSEFEEAVITEAEQEMLMQPRRHQAMIEMVGQDRMAQVERHIVCTRGGFDNNPDLVDGKLQAAEYWPCPLRGTCKYEGIGCDSLVTDLGHTLSKREIEVMTLTAKGLLDKEIADKLNVAETTVKTHTLNIRLKTGLAKKVDIARYATQKNLI